jgi:pimeloyl-ACP methyl ester carboxylesterase
VPRWLSPNEVFPARSRDIAARVLTLRNALRVRVVEGGAHGGNPVVMLHGWGASAYSFRHAFDRLGAHGLHVIAVDLRGFGLSDKPMAVGDYATARYLEDADQLLDLLAIERAPLVGHSMGGGIALHYALQRPERVGALALISPTNLVDIPFLRIPRLAPRFFARLFGRRLVPRFEVELILRWLAYGDPSLVTDDVVDQYWAPTQLPGYAYAARATLSEIDWEPISRDRAGYLAAPTVVMLGAKDRLVRNAGMAARSLRGSTVHEFPTGHCVHEELPERAYQIIGRHLSSAG